jgi:Flp pilus assembly protein protease CpaA
MKMMAVMVRTTNSERHLLLIGLLTSLIGAFFFLRQPREAILD